MKNYVDKDKLQEYSTKLTAKYKTVFALKGEPASDEQVETAVNAWLDEHPEATTTVEDGSITTAKLASGVIDNTLSVSGAAAEANKTGTEINNLKSALYAYAEPSDTTFIVSKGAIASDGNDNNAETYLLSRRRTNFGVYTEGSIITCDSAYTMIVYYYSSPSWRDYLSHGAYIGSAYVLPYVENAAYFRVMFKRTDGQNFADDEIPVVTFTRKYNKIDTIEATIPTLFQVRTIEVGTDLDTLYKSGWYLLGYSGSYPNSADASSGQRLVRVFSYSESATDYRIQEFINQTTNKYYVRVRTGGANGSYTSWAQINKQTNGEDNTNVIEYNNAEIPAANSANNGIDMTIMSYNVANYNNDTSTYINDTQLVNFKKMLSLYRPDIIGLQENREYIDADSSKLAHTYIYTPIFPYFYGPGGATIVGKNSGQNTDILSFSNGRATRIIYFTIDNKTLLFISVHPVAAYNNTAYDSAESIAARQTQYDELMKWVSKEITLNRYGTATPVSCRDWDWCIIAGDMNSITQTDRTNLKTLVEARNFTMANGGWLGWIKTEKTGYTLDNIVCSPNVIINSVEVPESLASGLWSDHYPIISHITLL